MAKILVVDDEQAILDFFSILFTRMGHHTLQTAMDGRTACDLAAKQDFDLIVSDLHMKGEPSRLELIKRLHELRPNCPIVIVTGYPRDSYLRECEKLGVKDILTKPFEMSFAKSVLSSLLPPDPASK